MGALSKILRDTENGGLMFWCPGCDGAHRVTVGEGPGPRWGYNGNPEAPTFTPSILIRSGHYIPGNAGGCWCEYNRKKVEAGERPAPFECNICHSFVTGGQIQFLGDCTHHLAGQTVPIPDWKTD